MKISRKGLVWFLAFLPLAGTAIALDGARLAASEQRFATHDAGADRAANDAGMEATCREVVVDTDEGYGVTSRESRFVCDENR